MEANLSLRPQGSAAYGVKVEIKNLNSFRAVRNSLEYEIERQSAILDAGGKVEQVTMGWLEQQGRTYIQRTKESAHDYRYFPEPDLPPLFIEQAWVDELRSSLPELPLARRARFHAEYGLGQTDADVLVADQAVADYYEQVVASVDGAMDAKKIANWFMGDLFRLLNQSNLSLAQSLISPDQFAALLKLVAGKTINANTGSKVLKTMFDTGEDAPVIVEREGLAQVSDADVLAKAIDRVLADHPDEVARYREGQPQLIGWFIGQVMRETRGKADPGIVRQVLMERLG